MSVGSSNQPPPRSTLNSPVPGPVGLMDSLEIADECQSLVPSPTLPSMSCSPYPLASFCPTGCVVLLLLPPYHAIWPISPYRLAALPPPAANSHSASVGRPSPTLPRC